MGSFARVSRLAASRRSVLIGALLVWGLASAHTIHVPSEYGSVQAGIDAAADGDEVVVAPGRYMENIQMQGKNIVLRSEDPLSTPVVAATILDGNGAGSVVTFDGTETTSCVLEGLTVTQGTFGGVAGNNTQASIQYNVIKDNESSGGGGLWGCDGSIFRNVIRDNIAACAGGDLKDVTGRFARMWYKGI